MHGALCRLPAALACLLCIAGCDEPPALEYFPLQEQMEWQYQISKTILNESFTQRSIIRSLEHTMVDGRKLYPQILANGKRYHFFVTDQGIHRLAQDNATTSLILKFPLQAGTEWTEPTRLFLFTLPKNPSGADRIQSDEMFKLSDGLQLDYEISSLDETVESQAGRFYNCLRVDAIGLLRLPGRMMLGVRTIKVRDTEWYCPGVGLVKKIRQEFALPLDYPTEYRQELTGFTRL
ncbi:MAG: hypothetical protein ACR2P9_09560 [Gammaproteobacteria bacterium]